MNTVTQTFKQIGFFTIALTLALVANFAYGQWANPTAAPVGGNVAVPINESSNPQMKDGSLTAIDMYAGTINADTAIAQLQMRSLGFCDIDGNNCLTNQDLADLQIIINNYAPETPPPPPSTQSCSIDGVSVAHGASRWFYDRTESSNCSAYDQPRTCDDGVLSGDSNYRYATCTAPPPPPPTYRSCQIDGITLAHGESRRFYYAPTSTNCQFRSSIRTCSDGNMTGGQSNHVYASCSYSYVPY